MYIQCTNGSPMVNTLDHLPLLPLFVYHNSLLAPTVLEQDELGIYHTLQLNGRIRDIQLDLPPSNFHKALTLMNDNFPILERLYLSCYFCRFPADSGHHLPLTLPKAFLAPNLLHLTLIGISLPKRLRVLTSTVSLVTLELRHIQTSSYFRPRLLVARLRSLPLLEELSIEFSIPIPRPSTERELLGEKGAPITLPSLKTLVFIGVGAFLDSLVAQIRVPLLEKLRIWLFNQIAFVLPNLFYLINITKVFRHFSAAVSFDINDVSVYVAHHDASGPPRRKLFSLSVSCKPLDWRIDCAAQICHALIPTLSGVEELYLVLDYYETPTELRNGGIDSATLHDLLRTFTEVKKLYITNNANGFLEEVSRALEVDGIGLDPGFLPNLRSILAKDNLFTSFIDTRQVVGRPVQFEEYLW